MTESQLPLVSVLFITYKRFNLLEESVRSFRKNTDYPNLELIIADDGSGAEIQDRIRQLPADVFALSPRNQGLGPNNNQGLSHCRGKYILMIQDDWQCNGPSDYLRQSVSVMEANPLVGIINYCGAEHPPDFGRPLQGSSELCYPTPEPTEALPRPEFLYSDQPHLISREAQDFIGPYIYHRQIENSEDDYRRRWAAQSRYSVAVFPAYYLRVFTAHIEAHSFRSSRARYRVGSFLQPLKRFLPAPAVKIGRFVVMRTIYGLEKLRLVR
jgi:glycosyltransferase involved in cell wall biosynthesis